MKKKTAADPCDRIIITFIHILIQMKYFIINEEFTNTFLVRYNNKGCNLYKFQIAWKSFFVAQINLVNCMHL